jgi:hypothetical protein
MSPEAFAALGAGLAMVKSKAVMGAVRLAVHGKVFATVGWPQAEWAIVKLSPRDQAELVALSDALDPEKGRRGTTGVTLVRLAALSDALAKRVLIAAWQFAMTSPAPLSNTG